MHLACTWLLSSEESEKDSEMQMGTKPIDCIIYGAARELHENTDVITNFLSRKRKLLLLLITDNFSLNASTFTS